ncbi:hypothetical protein C8F01DRAFT_1092468 [Mycena amicta]|nr:hypothetical protein C8F01DRAFT_1092468 [Mycena amicta]
MTLALRDVPPYDNPFLPLPFPPLLAKAEWRLFHTPRYRVHARPRAEMDRQGLPVLLREGPAGSSCISYTVREGPAGPSPRISYTVQEGPAGSKRRRGRRREEEEEEEEEEGRRAGGVVGAQRYFISEEEEAQEEEEEEGRRHRRSTTIFHCVVIIANGESAIRVKTPSGSKRRRRRRRRRWRSRRRRRRAGGWRRAGGVIGAQRFNPQARSRGQDESGPRQLGPEILQKSTSGPTQEVLFGGPQRQEALFGGPQRESGSPGPPGKAQSRAQTASDPRQIGTEILRRRVENRPPAIDRRCSLAAPSGIWALLRPQARSRGQDESSPRQLGPEILQKSTSGPTQEVLFGGPQRDLGSPATTGEV